MRLRPSGSQGPVATRLVSFIDYQRNSAWPGSISRSLRPASSPDRQSSGKPSSAPSQRCCAGAGSDTGAADVRIMRDKIEEEKGTRDIWDLKHVAWRADRYRVLAQFLQVVNGA